MDGPLATLGVIIRDQSTRRTLTFASHFFFFHVYFSHYVEYPTADFQKEIFSLTEDDSQRVVAITAFRGSAKSTIVSLSYPLWAILGKPQKKFVLLLGQTQAQARQHLKNLKDEIERNELLRKDLGPFEEREDEWHSSSIVLPKLGARITAASTETSVRGIRHGPHRPDLIICDDVEDLQSVKTREGRDKTYQWLMGEVIPSGSPKTRTFLIGNLLHEDCLLKRFKRHLTDGSMGGVYREYPLLDQEGLCLWPGKYPTEEALASERSRIGNEIAWQREFLLRIVSDSGRVVHPEWISYYDQLPYCGGREYLSAAIAIDLAISQSESADYTAMVSAKIFRFNGNLRIYILPNPINVRLTALETVTTACQLVASIGEGVYRSKVYVEDVAYQHAMVELLRNAGLQAKGVRVTGDKRARLALAANAVQSGEIFFPREGAEELILQLTGFGKEHHDDLADAFSLLILRLLHENRWHRRVRVFGRDSHAYAYFNGL